MSTKAAVSLAPRKEPRQRRSEATVDAIFDATIQVLSSGGSQRLTTTRVAERAGVSVGTLYQYFPNKQSLLHSVLERHLRRVGECVDRAARSAHAASLDVMVSSVVRAFVAAKTERVDEARALYSVASELDASGLVRAVSERTRRTIEVLLTSVPGQRFENVELVAFMWLAALVGPTRALLEDGAGEKMLGALPAQLESLSLAYLQREIRPRGLENRERP